MTKYLISEASPPALLYRIPVACHLLGIKQTKLMDLMKRGEIRSVKIDGATLFRREELERFAAGLEERAP